MCLYQRTICMLRLPACLLINIGQFAVGAPVSLIPPYKQGIHFVPAHSYPPHDSACTASSMARSGLQLTQHREVIDDRMLTAGSWLQGLKRRQDRFLHVPNKTTRRYSAEHRQWKPEHAAVLP